MNPETFPLAASFAYLHEVLTQESAPDDALARLRPLQAAHPDVRFDVVWEADFAGRQRYELMLGRQGEPTTCMSVVSADAMPFAMRGTQRWPEAQLLAVDGRRVFVHEAMLALDPIWNEARLLDALVDRCIIRRALEREPIEVDANELQAAVDRFRSERGLFDAAETERWLTARGMGHADLELAIEGELAASGLRRRVVGAEAEASFAADPRRWDRVALAAFAATDYAHAMACVEALRAGEPWLALAERVLGERTDGARSSRCILFETVRRRHIEPLGGFGLGDSMFLAAHLDGRGPYVVQVRSVEAAVWNDATRDAIEQELFSAWLAQARAEAHIEWNWGRDAA